jgi:hypothetical protein
MPKEIAPASGFVMEACGFVRSVDKFAELKRTLVHRAVIAPTPMTFAKMDRALTERKGVLMAPMPREITPVSGSVTEASGFVLSVEKLVTLSDALRAKQKLKCLV